MEKGTLSTALAQLTIAPDNDNRILPRQAVEVLVDNLRKKARATAWDVIRTAYRGLTCTTTAEGNGTRDWLERSLCLRPLVPYEVGFDVEMWLEQQSLLGHARRKDDAVGKWIICKVR